METEETQIQQEQEPPQPPMQKRGRGRPRKIAVSAPSNQINNQPADILQENQPETPTALMERRITRSMTRNAEPQPTE